MYWYAQKKYRYEGDFNRLQPSRKEFLTMLNRFLQEKRIYLQVYISFKTNFITNFLQRFLRNYIKCSNQHFHSRFYSPECHHCLLIVKDWEEKIAHLLPQEMNELNSPIVNNKLIQCLVSAYLLLHRRAVLCFTEKDL